MPLATTLVTMGVVSLVYTVVCINQINHTQHKEGVVEYFVAVTLQAKQHSIKILFCPIAAHL